jgi:4-amino-4-deoxy-L-arabinose transferase-like glycosyltransferase
MSWLALIGLLVLFFLWQFNHLGGSYWDTDEGLNLMKARMVQLGYPLYTEVWADQPPGFTALLILAFDLFGPSVAVGRTLTLLHATLCLLAVAWMVRELGGGWSGALMSVILLALAPNFFWASRATYRPAAILFWSGDRLTRIPEYATWVKQHYRLARTLGADFQLYVPAEVP